ncbi:MAG: O-antigen ligase family protein [Bacteroidia bacterium]|nr:O-antigen ligase family protein [Bacteroidia bacterium]
MSFRKIHLPGILFWIRLILFFKIFGFLALFESGALNKIIKIGLGTSMTIAILLLSNFLLRRGISLRIQLRNSLAFWAYCAYFVLAAISISWAFDQSFALIQLFRDLDLLIFSFLLIRLLKSLESAFPDQSFGLARILYIPVSLNAAYFLMGYFLAPESFIRLTHGGDIARLGGLIMNPNELGMLCSFGAACILLQFSSNKRYILPTLLLLICLSVMYLTGSRSSLIGFSLLLGLLLLRSRGWWPKILLIGSILFLLPFAAQKIIFNEEKGGAEEVLSMTGRIPFWHALLTEALPQEPLLGFGFMNIYYTKYFQGKNTYPATMTHNTFVQVLLNLGFLGASIVLIQMGTSIRAVIRESLSRKRREFWILFIPLFINSLTEFGIWGETNYGILFYQLLFLSFVLHAKPSKQEQLFQIPQSFPKNGKASTENRLVC